MSKKFFMSLGYVPFPDPEVIGNLRVRIRKGTYLHFPSQELDCKTKEEFLKIILNRAEELWDYIEEGQW